MRKKVLPFPAPPPHVDAPIACHHSRVNVRVGTQNFAIDITAQATILPSEPDPGTALRLLVDMEQGKPIASQSRDLPEPTRYDGSLGKE
jgi:hypothetical protein